jgi:NAD(P) transhydrogenase subunit alpha
MTSTALTDSLLVFVVATFLGLDVIRRVSPLLHTPLMSLTNAISAISVVGSIGLAGAGESHLATVLGTIAIASSMANVVGGFWITDRMLKMFKPRTPAKPAAKVGTGAGTGAAS